MSYLDDLRPGSFIAPESGTEHFFKFDSLSRTGGKKVATVDILDSNEGEAQDQGNVPPTFPMEIYFVDENYHNAADAFYKALSEKFKRNAPGVLRHPRWGDIDVIPLTWNQSEEFKEGAMVGRFSVEFRTTYRQEYPTTDAATESTAIKNIDDMADAGQDVAEKAKTDTQSSISNIKGKLSNAIGTVTGGLRAVAELTEKGISEFEEIQDSLNDTIDDVAGSLVSIIAGVQYLTRLPARMYTETLDKINCYADMITELINGFNDKNETVTENKINNAIMLETVGGMAVAGMAEAAVYTEYESRIDGSAAIDLLRASYDEFTTALEDMYTTGSIFETHAGDHNHLSLLQGIVSRICGILLDKTFNLKAERRRVLTGPSDAITLCWEEYEAIDPDTINFFCRTNKIQGNEFIEIPAGREVKFYG